MALKIARVFGMSVEDIFPLKWGGLVMKNQICTHCGADQFVVKKQLKGYRISQ